MVEGGLDPVSAAFQEHMNLCLQCMACHTVCPTDVSAGEVVARTKSYLSATLPPTISRRLLRRAVYNGVFAQYRRFELATLPLRIYNRSRVQALARRTGATRLLPGRLQRMEALLPASIEPPLRPRLAEVSPALGGERGHVAFHLTCVNNVLLAEASRASVRVLARNGCRVTAPPGVVCCGAPHETEGEMELARQFARHNIAIYEGLGVDAIVSDAAACGAVMKNYGHWLRDDPQWAQRAHAFSARVRDIHEYLMNLGLRAPAGRLPWTVTYADPCHLCHAQGISEPPRQILRAIPGLRFVELKDASWCCGSAGTYNISQPAMAGAILADKMARIKETGATVITSANPGCLLQLEAGLRRHKLPGRVLQVSQVLDRSYRKGDRTQ
jgi:glycolate oxidase iron-sulfur subunit